jgi:hypothetical protein
MRRDVAVDHVALALANLRHVCHDGAGHRTELFCVMREIRDPCAPDLILAWQACDIGTGTSYPPALHNSCSSTGVRHMPRQQLASRSAAENQRLIMFRLRHDLPPCVALGVNRQTLASPGSKLSMLSLPDLRGTQRTPPDALIFSGQPGRVIRSQEHDRRSGSFGPAEPPAKRRGRNQGLSLDAAGK